MAVIAAHVGAISASVAVRPLGVGREGGGTQDEDEGDFGQCFHGSLLKAVAWRGPARRDFLCLFTRHSLHALHRKRRAVSYKNFFNHGWHGWGRGGFATENAEGGKF